MDNEKKDRKINTNSEAKNFNALHNEEIEKYNNIFIKTLKNARETKSYTQQEAAEKTGVSLSTYRTYERGVNRKDTAFILHSLAKSLDVSADYLVGLSDTPHPEYKEVIASTGLNERAIMQLQKFHDLDKEQGKYQGYIDFVNCFLGNEACTELFFDALMPILRNLYDSLYGEQPSNKMANMATAQLADCITDYMKKVVVPTYGQQYHTGDYTSADTLQYLTDDAALKKK